MIHILVCSIWGLKYDALIQNIVIIITLEMALGKETFYDWAESDFYVFHLKLYSFILLLVILFLSNEINDGCLMLDIKVQFVNAKNFFSQQSSFLLGWFVSIFLIFSLANLKVKWRLRIKNKLFLTSGVKCLAYQENTYRGQWGWCAGGPGSPHHCWPHRYKHRPGTEICFSSYTSSPLTASVQSQGDHSSWSNLSKFTK